MNLSAHASRMTIDAARRTLVPPLLATAARIEADLASTGARRRSVGDMTTRAVVARPGSASCGDRAARAEPADAGAGLPPLLEDVRADLGLSAAGWPEC
jgi:hypothetical protein